MHPARLEHRRLPAQLAWQRDVDVANHACTMFTLPSPEGDHRHGREMAFGPNMDDSRPGEGTTSVILALSA